MLTLAQRLELESKGEVLVVDPPWDVREASRNGVRACSRWPHELNKGQYQTSFPFLMAYACAYLQQHGVNAHLTVFSPPRTGYETFLRQIRVRGYEVVLVETSEITWESDRRFITDVKGALPDAIVAAVGPYASAQSERCMEVADAVLVGEYERNALELWRTRARRIYPYNISYKVDEIPWPVRRDVVFGEVLARNGSFGMQKERQVIMWGSRGCPYRCSFCAWPPVMYNKTQYRPRSAGNILHEIDHYLDVYGGPEFGVWFDDDTFNIGNGRMKEIAEGMGERGVEWAGMFRADTTDYDTLRAMRDGGLKGCAIGVESGAQCLVDACGKRLSLERVREFREWCRELGVYVHATFTIGLEGETEDTQAQTMRFIRDMKFDSYQVSQCQPVAGTALYEERNRV